MSVYATVCSFAREDSDPIIMCIVHVFMCVCVRVCVCLEKLTCTVLLVGHVFIHVRVIPSGDWRQISRRSLAR